VPFSNGYAYKREITLDGAQIAGALADFPVLVKATLDPAKAHAAGYDIRFETPAGDKLDHQVESYSAGALTAWVRLPSLAAATSTTFDLFYGNAAVTTDSEANPAGVWSSFAGVWLLNEQTGGAAAFKDSTGNAHHMSSVGSQLTPGVPGKISYALSRNDVQTEVSRAITDAAVNLPAGPLTVMAWTKSNADAQSGNSQAIWEESGGRFRYYSTGSTGRQWRVYKTSGTLASLPGASADGSWKHVAVTVGTAGSIGFESGAPFNSNASVTSYVGTSNKVAVLGSSTVTQGMNGAISHLMIATADLGSDWVATAYANQNNPTTFATVGSEEAGGSDETAAGAAAGAFAFAGDAGGGRSGIGQATGALVVTGSANGTNVLPLTAPQNLLAAAGDQQVDLSWDAVGAAGSYDVERDGEVVAYGVLPNSYSDTTASAGVQHAYRVRAVR
jgi:hypothetical protein